MINEITAPPFSPLDPRPHRQYITPRDDPGNRDPPRLRVALTTDVHSRR